MAIYVFYIYTIAIAQTLVDCCPVTFQWKKLVAMHSKSARITIVGRLK